MKTLVLRLASLLFLFPLLAGTASAQRVDMVTAGGWISTTAGAHQNFGVNARDPANPSGHLNFVDHATGLHVVGDTITSYTIVNATTRTITGSGTADGVPVTFTCTLVDNGEPGTSDTFSLSLSSGFSASGTLSGGNVQVHPAG